MLLRANIRTILPSETEWVRQQQCHHWGEGDGGVAQREQHVDGTSNSAPQHTNHPGSRSVCGSAIVIVANSGAHFRVRRVLFKKNVLDCSFLLRVVTFEGVVKGLNCVLGQVGIPSRRFLESLQISTNEFWVTAVLISQSVQMNAAGACSLVRDGGVYGSRYTLALFLSPKTNHNDSVKAQLVEVWLVCTVETGAMRGTRTSLLPRTGMA